jgi:hypothetical protein
MGFFGPAISASFSPAGFVPVCQKPTVSVIINMNPGICVEIIFQRAKLLMVVPRPVSPKKNLQFVVKIRDIPVITNFIFLSFVNFFE